MGGGWRVLVVGLPPWGAAGRRLVGTMLCPPAPGVGVSAESVGVRGVRTGVASQGRNTPGEARKHRSGGKGSTFAKYRRSRSKAMRDGAVNVQAGIIPLLRAGVAEAQYPLGRAHDARYGPGAGKKLVERMLETQKFVDDRLAVLRAREHRRWERQQVEKEAIEVMRMDGWEGPIPNTRKRGKELGFNWALYDAAAKEAMRERGYVWGTEVRRKAKLGELWGQKIRGNEGLEEDKGPEEGKATYVKSHESGGAQG